MTKLYNWKSMPSSAQPPKQARKVRRSVVLSSLHQDIPRRYPIPPA